MGLYALGARQGRGICRRSSFREISRAVPKGVRHERPGEVTEIDLLSSDEIGVDKAELASIEISI